MPSKIRASNSKADPKEFYVGVNAQLNNVHPSSRHEKELCHCQRSDISVNIKAHTKHVQVYKQRKILKAINFPCKNF
jgi:hypothetical protein